MAESRATGRGKGRPSKLEEYRDIVINMHSMRAATSTIVERLRQEHGVTVSDRTLTNYLKKWELRRNIRQDKDPQIFEQIQELYNENRTDNQVAEILKDQDVNMDARQVQHARMKLGLRRRIVPGNVEEGNQQFTRITNLLSYSLKHKVLICRECKYAIQKPALARHLRRHKIFRGERQRLLSSIAQLELSEPDDVQPPPAGDPRVDGLPIISGYRCTAVGCASLCASFKRMRRHWSEVHGVSDPPDSCARPVDLQTFFRGTKLKYFEVASSRTAARSPSVTSDGLFAQEEDPDLMATPASNKQTSVFSPRPRYSLTLDLDMLRYFHHFTTTTSLTLPKNNHEPAEYWQTNVVAQALQLRWLMYGLLTISASHLAALSNEETTKRLHQERSTRFFEEFSTGWGKIKHCRSVAEVKAAKMGAQMVCIHRCCQWMSESAELGQGMFASPDFLLFHAFSTTIRGCVDSAFALRCELDRYEPPEVAFNQAIKDLEPYNVITSNVPPALLERLHTLPYRMAEVLPKPDSIHEFTSTLSGIDGLVQCMSLSYSSEDMGAAWAGMETWLRRTPEHFNGMTRERNAAMFIVIAHWLLLVERVERHSWFLRGAAKKALGQIVGEFSHSRGIVNLIEDLIA